MRVKFRVPLIPNVCVGFRIRDGIAEKEDVDAVVCRRPIRRPWRVIDAEVDECSLRDERDGIVIVSRRKVVCRENVLCVADKEGGFADVAISYYDAFEVPHDGD